MGSTNRVKVKKPVKLPTKKKAVFPAAKHLPEDRIAQALAVIDEAVAEVVDMAVKATEGKKPMPQTVLVVYDVLAQVKKSADAGRAVLKDYLIEHHKAGQSFTTGKAAASFKPDTSIRPEWKSEAFAEARARLGLEFGVEQCLSSETQAHVRAKANEYQFDDKAYEKAVRERYQAKANPVVNVTVGA